MRITRNSNSLIGGTAVGRRRNGRRGPPTTMSGNGRTGMSGKTTRNRGRVAMAAMSHLVLPPVDGRNARRK